MADNDSVRQRIITSLFSNRKADGVEETYVSHVKIWEDGGTEDGGQKPRYILLAQSSDGAGAIHKSKLNTNGSFSIGKTWKLSELRALEVLDPLMFSITLARSYRWQTENAREQNNFLIALVKLFRFITGGAAPLKLIGLSVTDSPTAGRQPIQNDYMRGARSPTPSNHPSSVTSPLRLQQAQSTRSTMRSPSPSRAQPPSRARAASPAMNGRLDETRSITPSRARPPSPSSESAPGALRPRGKRRPSNADSSSSTSGLIPAIKLPPTASTPIRPTVSTSVSSVVERSARPSLDVPPRSDTPPTQSPAKSATSLYGTPDGGTRSRVPSPDPSTSSRRTPPRLSRAPSPARSTQSQSRRDPNSRISFFDHANQGVLDRLLSTDLSSQTEADNEDESAQDTMANVEEMLEGYEWASGDMSGRNRGRGAADQIEANLLDELMALEKANIYAFLESDDRIGTVMKYLDDAISELDGMNGFVQSYKIHLNAVGDDISYIQSQNRGLQVQTQNQRALLAELEQLLQTVQVDREALVTLTQESLEKSTGIQRLEEALKELYKALQAGRDTDMAATMERLDEYRTHNAQFCKRLFDFLSIMFTAQANILLGDSKGVMKLGGKGRPVAVDHKELETYLGRYSGLMLYLKEMDESIYGRLCATYFSASSDLHNKQMKALFSAYTALIRKATEDDSENFGFNPSVAPSRGAATIRRAGTIVRSPLESRKDKDKQTDGDLLAGDAFGQALEQIAPSIYREQEFIADFLQINDVALTFADYMGLENYFRRQASRSAGLSQSTTKLVRGALDLIFGFLATELKSFIDAALAKDNHQLVGFICCLEKFLADADERGNAFLLHLLEKQHQRLKGLFDRHVDEQIKTIELTKLNSKKRRGVVQFVKFFPVYVGRMENQLIGADGLEIRGTVDQAYDKIVQTMFDSLKQMAKLDGEGEDKGQLNYHVILIENMHYFVADMAQQELGSVARFSKRAESIYDENLSAYVKLILRRPFSKIIDYFDGVERLLKTTVLTEVSSNSNYNKSALKKVVKEFNSKDVRKHVDGLFKRVEKHFTDSSEKATTEGGGGVTPGTVMVGVWKACEEELLRNTELFSKRITQCYGDSGVALEYSAADVEASFKRHRVGS